MTTLLERFTDKYGVNEDTGCWEWIAHKMPAGYGRVWDGEKDTLAHRVAYELFVGPISAGLQIDHLCRVTSCVNPSHLEAVTCRENLLRGDTTTARNAKKTHCIHGHEFTAANTYHHKHRSTTARSCRICTLAKNRRWKAQRAVAA